MRAIEPRRSRAESMKMFEEQYLKQTGSGLPAFTGVQYQRGHGLGNMLRSLTRLAVPLLKKGAKLVGKQALRTGIDIARDAAEGQNVKRAAKRRMSQGLKELVMQRGSGFGPPGQRVKRRRSQSVSKKKKTKTTKSQKVYKRKAPKTKGLISHRTKRRKASHKRDALS